VTQQPDQYTLPSQPVASAVERPLALLRGAGGVVGLRAATARLDGPDRLLDVWLYGDPPAAITVPGAWSLRPAPGAPVPGVVSVASVPAGTDAFGGPVPSHLTLTLDSVLPGRGVYQLRLDPTVVAVDPLRAFLPVRLRPECGDLADRVDIAAPPRPVTPPDYDTLARDYAGLRAMLMERLQFLDAQADTSPADLTVTLAEFFAHLGDLLHYRLDRIATETWLSTARRRANVARHARAVDFPVYPATSAASTVQVMVTAVPGTDRRATILPGDTATNATETAADGSAIIGSSAANFTLEAPGPVVVRASHAEVALYDWTEDDAALSARATSAVLVRPAAAAAVPVADWLPVGSVLAFEVVAVTDLGRQRGWVAGTDAAPDDAWPREPLASYPAQVVTVTAVAEFADPLRPGADLLRVFWDGAEALSAPVPCSVDQTAGPVVGVARLGLLRAHHGLRVDGPGTLAPVDRLTGLVADPATSEVSDYVLAEAGPEAAPGLSHAPGGRPWQLDVTVSLPNGTQVPARRVTSMLRVPAAGFSVVVDADDELPAVLRFRTGALGLVPPAGSVVSARYQVGAGASGNIAANVLTRLVRSTTAPGAPCVWIDVTDNGAAVVRARNVTPGTGGTAAASLDSARRDAPLAYSAVPRRAVLIGDLPGFAVTVPTVLGASASRSWSGSWPVGVVAHESVSGDRDGAADQQAAARVQAQVQSILDSVRMAGTEVVSVAATPVGILIALTVCLYPGSDPAGARAAILARLRPGDPSAPGLFAPGSHPMGTDVYLSAVVAAVAALPQVDAVAVTEARRLSDPAGTLDAVIVMGPAEVAVCDDDPDAPDRGRIVLNVEGGR
jgi:hypothetical protein